MTWTLPKGAEKGHVAVLGKTGSGKTYAAKTIVEGLLGNGAQVCIIDPTSAWWGLRLDAEGKHPAFGRVVLLGGEKGDLPLPPTSGAAAARLVTQQGASVVLDTGGMSVGEYTRFFTAFAQELYSTIRAPLHLVIDEAHQFMPQGGGGRMDPEAGKMLHAGNRLMSGGRSRGVRAMLITQRPAKLHKDSLTCADTLIAMRVIAPQDRQAIKDWIDGAGDAKQAKAVLDSLAGLKRGEGWVWYPEGGYLERITFPRITTFDSSATPDGATIKPSVGAIELGEIKKAMDEAVREAEANDPKRLRARIVELEEKVAGAQRDAETIDTGRMAQLEAEREAATAETADLRQRIDNLRTTCESLDQHRAWMLAHVHQIRGLCETIEREQSPSIQVMAEQMRSDQIRAEKGARPAADLTKPAEPDAALAPSNPQRDAAEGLSKPQTRLIDAIAWWNACGVREPSRVQVAHVTGYTPSSGTWRNLLASSRSLGLIEYRGDALVLAEKGRRMANHPSRHPTRDLLHARVRDQLTGPQRKLFGLLTARCGKDVTRTEAAERCGYEPTSGTWRNLLASMVSLGLAKYTTKTTIAAAEWLFPQIPN